MPNYNGGDYLKIAIQSVLQQSYTNWELLIVDNNSSDNSKEILKEFTDLRIHKYRISNNGCIAASRNLGLKHAQGEWVAFLDADDFWEPEKLEICSNFFNPANDFLYHNLVVIPHEGSGQVRGQIKSRQLKKPVWKDLLLGGNTIATSSVLVRLELLKSVCGMDESKEMIGTEDFNTWLRISKKTDKFKHLNKYLGFYRVHDSNASKNTQDIIPWAAIRDFHAELSTFEKEQFELNSNYVEGRRFYLIGEFEKSKARLKKSITPRANIRYFKSIWMLFRIFLHTYR